MRRAHLPCRVCGYQHTNPRSSSICPECGAKEHDPDENFGAFMNLDEEDRWLILWRAAGRPDPWT